MYKDILGQELRVGDRIAYAKIGSGTDHGSLGIGRIVELKDTGNSEQRYVASKTWESTPILAATIEWETNSLISKYPGFGYDKPKKSTVTKLENMVKL